MQVFAWKIEYHSPVVTSRNEIFNDPAHWTIKKKMPVPLGLGKLHWVTVTEEI